MDEAGQLTEQTGATEVGFAEVRHGFRLGEYRLMLPAGTFSELSNKVRICALPDTPAWFAGFINHRGHTVPVFDLNLLLGGERLDHRQNYWILLIDRQPKTAGLIVRQLPQALNDPEPCAPDEPLEQPPLFQPYLHKTFRHRNELWFEIDHHGLLGHLKRIFHQSGPVAGTNAINDNDSLL